MTRENPSFRGAVDKRLTELSGSAPDAPNAGQPTPAEVLHDENHTSAAAVLEKLLPLRHKNRNMLIRPLSIGGIAIEPDTNSRPFADGFVAMRDVQDAGSDERVEITYVEAVMPYGVVSFAIPKETPKE